MARKHVFISIGTPYAEPQSKFLDALIELLREFEIEPRAVNKTDFLTANPLKEISRIMRECDAAIIVAYERTYFSSGIEKRQSAQEKELKAVRYTTPWNQIEAAMAVALGLPIIVMIETGLQEEGLLEDKYDWYIERLPISADAFTGKDVRDAHHGLVPPRADRSATAFQPEPDRYRADDFRAGTVAHAAGRADIGSRHVRHLRRRSMAWQYECRRGASGFS